MRRLLSRLLAAALLICCLAGCGGGEQAEENTPVKESALFITPGIDNQEREEASAELGDADFPEGLDNMEPRDRNINPLTGEPAEQDELAYRPYIVMVNNIVVAQPLVGVGDADMLWELMDEGGITRMMAFFKDIESVEKIGSVRSARWYNVSVAQAFDAIFVHAGGSGEALDYIDYDGISDVDYVRGRYTDGTFYRDPARQAHGIEHSLFAVGGGVVRSAESLGYSLTHPDWYYDFGDEFYGLYFSDDEAGEQCTGDARYIRVTYAGGKSTNFTYDEETGMYTAEQYGSTIADNGEETVYFKNVIIMNADTVLQEDGLHLTITMEGSGNGYFCCGGGYTPIQWERDGYLDNFHYYTMDGQPLRLSVGRTFVAVQQVGEYKGTTEFFG